MNHKLTQILEQVHDEETFIAFVSALAEDKADEDEKEKLNSSSPCGPGANGWENGTLATFLESAAEWASTSRDGLAYYSKPENPWKRCADILYMGKIYE